MARLLVFLVVLALTAQVIALGQPLFQQEEVENNDAHHINYGRLRSAAEGKLPRFEPLESVLRRLGVRVLPMKRSIAIGRAGFRPGKRSADIFEF